MDVFAHSREFRQATYKCLCKASDATFELMDSILLTRNAYSLADLSLCPVFRRKWSSVYEALQDTKVQRNKLMGLYIKNIPSQERIILAGDHTAWSRPNAPTLKEITIRTPYPKWNRRSPSNSRIWLQHTCMGSGTRRKLGITIKT